MLSKVWTAFFALAFVFGCLSGRIDAVTSAVTAGAEEAVTLLLQITGLMMLWSGVMEILSASGLGQRMEWLLRPLLRPLFGKARQDAESMELVSANVTANLLGLSNAATPIGLRAVDRLYTLSGRRGTPDSVLTLIVLNTTSVQLIPSTVAAIRAGYGAANPFDIMPAVWGASILSVLAAQAAARLLRPAFPPRGN